LQLLLAVIVAVVAKNEEVASVVLHFASAFFDGVISKLSILSGAIID
jgi:hypothetical protein